MRQKQWHSTQSGFGRGEGQLRPWKDFLINLESVDSLGLFNVVVV